MEELYRKYQGKTIKDDYGKNSKEFIDFANDMKKSMKINAAKYGLRLILLISISGLSGSSSV